MIKALILIHASLGGIALLSGLIALISRKGSTMHKRFGKVFAICMTVSIVLSIVIALLPGHFQPFLLGIGLFSLYFTIMGYRALQYRSVTSYKFDNIAASLYLLLGLCMLTGSILTTTGLNVVLLVFGGVCTLNAIKDLRKIRKPDELKRNWLKIHLGYMTGSYIAAFTAFLVVNQFISSVMTWFLPSIIFVPYIFYQNGKIDKAKRIKNNN